MELNNKKISDIIEYTQKNGGCSFNKELNILNNLKGYTISILKYEYKTTIKNKDAITKNIMQKIDILNTLNKNYIIGMWIDNDILYIDINKIELNYTRAMEFAKIQKQLAIYDNVNNKSIYLKKDYTYILYQYIEDKKDLQYIMEFTKKELLNFLKIRDIEYYKNFIYYNYNNDINKYFIKNNKKYVLIKEEL